MELKLGIFAGIVILIAILLMSNNVEPSWDGNIDSIKSCPNSSGICQSMVDNRRCADYSEKYVYDYGYQGSYDVYSKSELDRLDPKQRRRLTTLCTLDAGTCDEECGVQASCSKYSGKCPTGFSKDANKKCQGSGSKSCSSKLCCTENASCSSYNNCPSEMINNNNKCPGISSKSCSSKLCCSTPTPPPKASCSKYSGKCPTGFSKDANKKCQGSGSKSCSSKLCCTENASCSSYNNCPSEMINNNNKCPGISSKSCSSKLCCSTPPPTPPTSNTIRNCGAWYNNNNNNRCPRGTTINKSKSCSGTSCNKTRCCKSSKSSNN